MQRRAFPILAFAVAVACILQVPALAQQAAEPQPQPPGAAQPATEGQPSTEAEDRGLTSPEVEGSLTDTPTDEGMINPEVTEEEEGAAAGPDLYGLLDRVRSAPPDYAGNPVPRPNPLGSEPGGEMAPAQPQDMSLFPDGYVE